MYLRYLKRQQITWLEEDDGIVMGSEWNGNYTSKSFKITCKSLEKMGEQ